MRRAPWEREGTRGSGATKKGGQCQQSRHMHARLEHAWPAGNWRRPTPKAVVAAWVRVRAREAEAVKLLTCDVTLRHAPVLPSILSMASELASTIEIFSCIVSVTSSTLARMLLILSMERRSSYLRGPPPGATRPACATSSGRGNHAISPRNAHMSKWVQDYDRVLSSGGTRDTGEEQATAPVLRASPRQHQHVHRSGFVT